MIYLAATVDITPVPYMREGFSRQSQILYRWDNEYNLDVSSRIGGLLIMAAVVM